MRSPRITTVRPLRWTALCIAAVTLAACSPVSHWPPAVTSVDEIEQLPTTQRDIRGIDLGDAELELIAERFIGLEYIYLNSGSLVTDSGVRALSSLKDLRQVVIGNASRISDDAILVLVSMPSLTELIVDNGISLTDASIDAISEESTLRILYLNDCSQFSAEATNRIRRRLSSCEIRFD